MRASQVTFNKSLKYVPGLAAVHRTSLTGRRLAPRYMVKLVL